jgi:very-short-patch-repair endonuclease
MPAHLHAGRVNTNLYEWLSARDGIARRDKVLHAGFPVAVLRAFVRVGHARMIRRAWVALDGARADLVSAAEAGGRVSCVSLARARGWWMPDDVETNLHLHLIPGSGAARMPDDWPGVLHWTKPIVPSGRELTATVEDALAQIAICLPFDKALVLWESAARKESLAAEALRGVRWTSLAARELAEAVTGLSDSGLETLVVTPLRRWGVQVRQQVVLAGRPVDVLVGDRLVLQIDGYEHHSSSAQRAKDIAHDAELRLRGYTVFRLSYSQVVHDWPAVERRITRALAAGLHLAR